MVFNAIFNNMSVVSCLSVLLVKSTQRKPPSCHKSLTNFITLVKPTSDIQNNSIKERYKIIRIFSPEVVEIAKKRIVDNTRPWFEKKTKQCISNIDVLYYWKCSLNLRFTKLRENILTPNWKRWFWEIKPGANVLEFSIQKWIDKLQLKDKD